MERMRKNIVIFYSCERSNFACVGFCLLSGTEKDKFSGKIFLQGKQFFFLNFHFFPRDLLETV